MRGELPERPDRWTGERAQLIAAGQLEEWTTQDVEMHLAGCSCCRKIAENLARTLAQAGAVNPAYRRIDLPGGPPDGRARLAWGLVTVEGVAVVGLALWIALSPLPRAQPPQALMRPDWTSGGAAAKALLWVKFAPSAVAQHIAALLSSLDVAIVGGPDAEGYFTVRGDHADLETLISSPVVVDSRAERGDKPGTR